MKRLWRPGRTILAVMLVGVAAMMFFFWPKVPRWKLSNDIFVGFDDKQQLLLTTKRRNPDVPANILVPENIVELRGYDFSSGQCTFSQTYLLKGVKTRAEACDFMVSPDGNVIIVCDRYQGILQAFDLKTGALRCQLTAEDKYQMDLYRSVGFSPDGMYFAACDYNSASLLLWDLTNGQVAVRVSIPSELMAPSNPSIRGSGGICISADRRFAALELSDRVIVCDLVNKGQINHFRNVTAPRFTANGKVLTTLTYRSQPRGENRYVFTDPSYFEVGAVNEKEGLLCVNDDLYVTAEETPCTIPGWPLLQKLPKGITKKMTEWLGYPKLNAEMTVWRRSTREPLHRFSLSLKGEPHFIGGTNADGSLLALDVTGEVTLWDIPPRRSLFCWISCGSMVTLAFWLAWPRKSKAA
jgi:hypothetical protein